MAIDLTDKGSDRSTSISPWPRTAVVIGAGRGLGREFVRQLAARPGVRVFAGLRRRTVPAAAELYWKSDTPALLITDYTTPATLIEAARTVACNVASVDLLINCGAINKIAGRPPGTTKTLSDLVADDLLVMLGTNTVGPIMAAQAFWPLMSGHPESLIVNMTTGRASFSSDPYPNSFGYTVSKAALNMVTRNLAAEAGQCGPRVVGIDPGWVRTDMGGSEAPLSPQQSVREMLQILAALPLTESGRLLSSRGEYLQW